MERKSPKTSLCATGVIAALLILSFHSCRDTNTKTEVNSIAGAESEERQFDDTKEFTALTGRIKNGDTFTVFVDGGKEVTIQLADIDAPEGGQAYGKEAKDMLFMSTDHYQVRIIPHGRDSFDRLLGTVFINNGNTNLNELMVKKGAAWHYNEFSTDTCMARLQQEAREKSLGLWADPNPIPPWEYRRLKRRGQ